MSAQGHAAAAAAAATAAPVLGVETWIREHGHELVPPIANKLVHRGALLSAMMVGGPNARQDFHCEPGPEFFLQLRGDMELVTVQHKRRTPVPIRQGYACVQVRCVVRLTLPPRVARYLLPPCVLHSPQRPNAGSVGLVLERVRNERELDSLTWFSDFATCDEVLFERYFVCRDLGKDLVAVVNEFNASEAKRTLRPAPGFRPANLHAMYAGHVPDPVHVDTFVDQAMVRLDTGRAARMFPRELGFNVVVLGKGAHAWESTDASQGEVWLYQWRGQCALAASSPSNSTMPLGLREHECCVVDGRGLRVEMDGPGSALLAVALSDVPKPPPSSL